MWEHSVYLSIQPGHEGHLLLGNATNCHAEDALHGVICRP